ncbi:asparagine synthase-related protein [Clostridium sp.]|uniref:asparagine synthase-related protein n=1 Tax=Clostridium sp. TaxID=1506 RepID=UPI002B25DBB0|nr:asparagine synthase-related protein [Clostridium sp.]
MLKNMINKYLLEQDIRTEKVALLFSSGMDSLSILLSCLEVGIKPRLYTFYLDNHVSDDVNRSREVAKILNLDLTEIKIDTHVVNLESDIELIIKTFKTQRKTAIQCIHPFLYVIPKVREKYILTGLCADDLYGTARSMAKLGNDYKKFDETRLKRLKDETASSYCYIKRIAEEQDKILLVPYKENQEIISYMLGLNYKEMNSPKQKNIMYEDYKDILEEYKLYRRNSNLQCDSKIREWHDTLLQDKTINSKNNKSIVAIYNKIYKEVFGDR